MKLQRTTWILLLLALLLGGGVYYYEVVNKSRQAKLEAKQGKLFNLTEDQITGFAIEKEDERIEITRTGKEESPWRMTKPERFPAETGAIEFLLNLLVEGERDRIFLLDAEDKAEYGLDEPFGTIKVSVSKQIEPETIVIGDENFDGKLVYALINPKEQDSDNLEVVLIPIDFKYAIERDLEEWQQQEEEDSEEDSEDEDSDDDDEDSDDEDDEDSNNDDDEDSRNEDDEDSTSN